MATYVHNSDDLTPLMTSNLLPTPFVVSSDTFSSGFEPYKAFTHSMSTIWVAAGSTLPRWLKFDFGYGSTNTVTSYTISTSATGNYYGWGPKTWTLQGSNNDSDWFVLDTQTDVSSWSADEMREYEVASPTYYRYYKLNVTTTQPGYQLSIGELELIGFTTTYYVSGHVTENTTPVNRQIYLHNRDTGELVGETTSSGAGGYFYMETTYSGSHYVVCLDDAIGVSYNDLIYGNIYPVTISG